MQPEAPQQMPTPQGGPSSQEVNPAIATAFQSVSPHPMQMSQTPGQAIQLPKEPRHLGGLLANILLTLALLGALGFGIWAFMSRTDYKTNSDKKSAVAVTKALADQKVKADAEYAEKDKLPYTTYSGPSASGSIKMQYPRTWSAYITEDPQASTPIDAYVHPSFVPNVQDINIAFALRMQVINSTYTDALRQFDSNITQGTVRLEPFAFPGVSGSLGSKLTGGIKPGSDKVQGTMVLMPLRDKTIKIWTESNSAFGKDFNTAVLANFSFVP